MTETRLASLANLVSHAHEKARLLLEQFKAKSKPKPTRISEMEVRLLEIDVSKELDVNVGIEDEDHDEIKPPDAAVGVKVEASPPHPKEEAKLQPSYKIHQWYIFLSYHNIKIHTYGGQVYINRLSIPRATQKRLQNQHPSCATSLEC